MDFLLFPVTNSKARWPGCFLRRVQVIVGFWFKRENSPCQEIWRVIPSSRRIDGSHNELSARCASALLF